MALDISKPVHVVAHVVGDPAVGIKQQVGKVQYITANVPEYAVVLWADGTETMIAARALENIDAENIATEQTPAQQQWEALYRAAQQYKPVAVWMPGTEPIDAVMAAEDNAMHTIDVEKAAPASDFIRLALGSISSTDAFTKSARCRAWFKRHGYTW